MSDDILRYSDLIAPDNSIDDLIQLLGKVQNEYSALSQAAKQYAANMQVDMRRINTSTKAGRDELARLTAQTDTLNDVIRGLGAGYDLIDKKLAEVRGGTSEASQGIAALANQVRRYSEIARGMRNMREVFEIQSIYGLADDNLVKGLKELENVVDSIGPELNKYIKSITEAILESIKLQETLDFDAAGRAAKDSLSALESALEGLIDQYKAFEAEDRGSDIGKATKNNLDILSAAVTKLNAEIEPLVDKTTKLIEAQQGLEVATSEEGKQAVALKQKIAELNKETALRATIVEELSDSEKALKAQLQLALGEWSKLGEVEQNSAAGVALQDRIKNLKTIIAEMTAKLKPAKAELTALEQAQQILAKATKALDVALTDEGKAAIVARQALSELNKETRLQAKEANSADGSYDQLKAQLQQAVISYRALSKAERENTAEGQALEAQIISLRNQLKGLDDRTKAASASMTESQRITKQTAAIAEKLAQAKVKVKIATSDEYRELMKLSEEQREANRIAKLQAQYDAAEEGSYNRMAALYELNKIKLRKLAMANRELTEDEKKLVAETYTLRNEMKKFQEMTGVHTLSVGEYGKVWDSFGFSIQQIVREMPAAAQGINNLFIAVSNNIPIFVDELMKLRKENAALIAQNRQDEVVSIGKRIAASLFSWQTALMSLLTVLTMFGDDILKWIGSLFKGEAAVMSMRKAIRNLNKELENSNDSYGDNMASFKKLQNQWAALTTEAEKMEWIKNHEEAFEDLGLAINDVVSAEQVLVNQADAVEETFRRRAIAAAATTLAAEEYEKALLKTEKAERKKKELAESWAKSHNANIDRFYADRFGYGSDDRQGMYLTADDFLENWGKEVYTMSNNGSWSYFAVDAKPVNRLKSEAKAAEETAEQYLKLGAAYDDLLDDDKKGRDSEGRDLTDRIYQARLQAAKKYNEAQTKLIKDEYDRRQRELEDAAQAEIETLKEQRRKAKEWRDDPENDYEELTAEEQRAVQEIISKSSAAILNIEKKLAEDVEQLELDRQINELKIYQDTLNLRLESVKEGSYAEMALREQLLQVQRDLELKENEKTIKVIKAQNAKAARAANEDFINMLKSREAFKPRRYVDNGRNPTIGYGFTKYTIGQEITDDMVFTEEEADALLRDRIKNVYEPALNQVLDKYGLTLNQAQYNELLDLSYQGGGAVARLIEDAIDDEEGLAHIRQVYRDVGSQIGADAAERFGESFEQAYLEADTIGRMGLLLQAENLYTGGVIGGEGGSWYAGMQARSDSRSERFMAEPAPEEIERNKQLEADIVLKWNKKIADLTTKWSIRGLEQDQARIELKLQTVQKGTEEELELQKELLDKQLELDLKRNSLLGENLQKDETLIKKSYARRKKLLEGQYMLEAFQEGQAASRAQYIADNKAGNKGMKSKQLNDYYLGIYDQEQAIALLEEQIWQAEQGFLDWSPAQIAEAKANLVTLNRELDETKDIWNLIGEKGIGGGILTSLGFKDDQIDAFMEATNIVISQIQAIAQAEVDAAQKAVEAAQERVDAAKSAYDAEIEARNNGYANNVATAKKELEQEKKKQREKQKLLEAAQRNQARIDSAMQTSSLVTATANLWASYSKLGPLGQALTIAAIATMWGSFGAAKIKAKNVTSQEYGEGGLEFLEGGSHASGHDIDLGTVNSRGRRMRAEGGEAMAIINKRNTRKYKALLPGIVESLNAGNFEEKYLSSLSTSGLSLSVNNASIDLSKIEDDVADIKKQNQVKYYTAEGYLIVQDRNVKRIIKN